MFWALVSVPLQGGGEEEEESVTLLFTCLCKGEKMKNGKEREGRGGEGRGGESLMRNKETFDL